MTQQAKTGRDVARNVASTLDMVRDRLALVLEEAKKVNDTDAKALRAFVVAAHNLLGGALNIADREIIDGDDAV